MVLRNIVFEEELRSLETQYIIRELQKKREENNWDVILKELQTRAGLVN